MGEERFRISVKLYCAINPFSQYIVLLKRKTGQNYPEVIYHKQFIRY